MESACPTVLESLVRIWIALHRDVPVRFIATDIPALRREVFHMDDDLIARLLSAKLSVARTTSGRCPVDIVRVGSEVVYSLEGHERRVRIGYGSASTADTAGVGSHVGAALLGLSAGQSLLWPFEGGRLVEFRILDVRPRKPMASPQPIIGSHMGSPCASG
jgi:regulator of nucleoside diphosphate kinase